MENDFFTTPRVVLPNGPFMPLVFVDIGMPTAFVAAAARSIGKEFDDSKNKFSSSFQTLKRSLTPLKIDCSSELAMLNSIDDISI